MSNILAGIDDVSYTPSEIQGGDLAFGNVEKRLLSISVVPIKLLCTLSTGPFSLLFAVFVVANDLIKKPFKKTFSASGEMARDEFNRIGTNE